MVLTVGLLAPAFASAGWMPSKPIKMVLSYLLAAAQTPWGVTLAA